MSNNVFEMHNDVVAPSHCIFFGLFVDTSRELDLVNCLRTVHLAYFPACLEKLLRLQFEFD